MITQHYHDPDRPRYPLLSVDNSTMPGLKLPEVDASDARYRVGYFQNQYGEQWIFVGDCQEHKATFWSGDVGWAEDDAIVIEVTADTKSLKRVILNEPEMLWITACLATVGLQETASKLEFFDTYRALREAR